MADMQHARLDQRLSDVDKQYELDLAILNKKYADMRQNIVSGLYDKKNDKKNQKQVSKPKPKPNKTKCQKEKSESEYECDSFVQDDNEEVVIYSTQIMDERMKKYLDKEVGKKRLRSSATEEEESNEEEDDFDDEELEE